jgi:undecaprenyl diphosphate synthase
MHVAIVMDGNGRWATKRGLPRPAGHVEGAKAVRTTVEAAARAGIETLTLYAFSAANWARPRGEVEGLMFLLRRYLFTETRRCIDESIRLSVIGRRDRLDDSLLRAIEHSEQLSAECKRMHLRIAVDYSAQNSILQAARRIRRSESITAQEFHRLLNEVNHSTPPAGEVDLLIRTGGEKRLSDFLLWESAYAELYFTDCLWPDFSEEHFQAALQDYAGRARRFGKVNSETCDSGMEADARS